MKTVKVQIDVSFQVRMVVYPAGDIKDVWIAHGLDFDVVTQGGSQQEAMAMLEAAIDELVDYRITHGLPPIELRAAPEEIWELGDAAFGERLSREPVSVWMRAGKSDPASASTNSGGGSRSSIRPTAYVSQHPPMLHAGPV